MGAGIEQRPWTPTVRRGPIAAEIQTPAPNSFDLPPLIGYKKVVISSKPTASAFSFGQKHKQIFETDGPGPAIYDVTGLSVRAGKVVSRESTLGARPLPRKQFQTPAPGEYEIDKIDKSKLQAGGCIRGYTFGHPNVEFKSSRIPANQNSVLTKRAPAYSFGMRTEQKIKNDLPGPFSYSPEKCKLDQKPKFSFGSKTEQKIRNDVPAPNSYNPNRPEDKPKFSFGSKTEQKIKNDVPAPNSYNPTQREDAPKYSFGSKTEQKIKNDVPAPNMYSPSLPEDAPKFSLSSRTEQKIRNDVPAPNSYNPSQSEDSPRYSFGTKTEQKIKNNVPAPNSYNPNNHEEAPKYSFGVKTERKIRNDSPAPGSYSPEKCNFEHQPSYSFGVKPEQKIRNDAPAPNMYSPSQPDFQPSYSFGSRIQQKVESIAPAPNAYSVENCKLEHQPSYSFGTRPEQKIRSDTPAPNIYTPSQPNHLPAFTFGVRTEKKIKSTAPAPNAYSLQNVKLDHQPSFSFGGRYNLSKPSQTPAPTAYQPEKAKLNQTPAYSFGIKTKHEKFSDTPAANEYTIPPILGSSKEGKIRSAPAYTITGRQKQPEPQVVRFPGPGTYDGRYEVILKKPPVFSMGERFTKEKSKDTTPGPGAHFPEKQICLATAYGAPPGWSQYSNDYNGGGLGSDGIILSGGKLLEADETGNPFDDKSGQFDDVVTVLPGGKPVVGPENNNPVGNGNDPMGNGNNPIGNGNNPIGNGNSPVGNGNIVYNNSLRLPAYNAKEAEFLANLDPVRKALTRSRYQSLPGLRKSNDHMRKFGEHVTRRIDHELKAALRKIDKLKTITYTDRLRLRTEIQSTVATAKATIDAYIAQRVARIPVLTDMLNNSKLFAELEMLLTANSTRRVQALQQLKNMSRDTVNEINARYADAYALIQKTMV